MLSVFHYTVLLLSLLLLVIVVVELLYFSLLLISGYYSKYTYSYGKMLLFYYVKKDVHITPHSALILQKNM